MPNDHHLDPDDPIDAVSLAWLRERPGTPVTSIGIATRIRHAAKLLGEERRRVLAAAGADPATLDLLGALRRSGPPYRLTTRDLAERTLVTPGAISQRIARAERDGLVERSPRGDGSRAVDVALTPAGHDTVERLVDRVLGRESELVAGLPPGDRAALDGLLRTLLRDLNAQLDTESPSRVATGG
ncbi:MarR family winged helix-turn-helix transcriptional regulator [Nocardiopsis mangrovi]|uniref:MarR family winged helix-turn-helix transcriptional regulator n=1 Tax=Nocardiopsis mangrovi TaxID=1179818 RepID=A0ABV9DXM7_9ACTN